MKRKLKVIGSFIFQYSCVSTSCLEWCQHVYGYDEECRNVQIKHHISKWVNLLTYSVTDIFNININTHSLHHWVYKSPLLWFVTGRKSVQTNALSHSDLIIIKEQAGRKTLQTGSNPRSSLVEFVPIPLLKIQHLKTRLVKLYRSHNGEIHLLQQLKQLPAESREWNKANTKSLYVLYTPFTWNKYCKYCIAK